MSADDPTLIEDQQPTLRMPRPGGQATVAAPREPAASGPTPRMDLQRLVAGVNPVLAAAGTLLALVAQLRATTVHEDPERLRMQLLQAVADFEATAAANGVPRPQIGAARYLLCSFIDEVIMQTPWGASSRTWNARSLLQEFHEERSGAEKSFQLLERLGQEPAINADLLELFYVCLQLGFEGRYHGVPHAREQLDAIAARVFHVVRPDASAHAGQPRTMAVHWKGVALGRRSALQTLPLWALVAVGAGSLLALVLALDARVDAMAQPVLRDLVAAPVAAEPRAEGAARPRLASLLQADVARGALQVSDGPMRSVVRLSADSLFVPGSAQLDARVAPLLARIAQALKDAPGEIAVIGHTDDAAQRSLQFPSNWHLSRARAEAVQAALVRDGVPARRVRFEGRGEVEPLDRSDSAAARARNRRIEIEWRLPRPEE